MNLYALSGQTCKPCAHHPRSQTANHMATSRSHLVRSARLPVTPPGAAIARLDPGRIRSPRAWRICGLRMPGLTANGRSIELISTITLTLSMSDWAASAGERDWICPPRHLFPAVPCCPPPPATGAVRLRCHSRNSRSSGRDRRCLPLYSGVCPAGMLQSVRLPRARQKKEYGATKERRRPGRSRP